MATVTNTIKLPGNVTPTHAAVEIELVASTTTPAAGWVTATDVTVLATYRPTVTAGAWSVDLTPNANITPSGTVYKVTEYADRRRYVHYISVGAGGGSVHDLLVDAPASLPSAALTDHINDTADAHDASAVSFTPAGDHLSTTVQAAIEQTATGRVLPDMAWSWWVQPLCIYNELRQRIYHSGISRGGVDSIGWFDLRHNTTHGPFPMFDRAVDDHNAAAILIEDDEPPIFAGTGHSNSPVEYRIGFGRHEVQGSSNPTGLTWSMQPTYAWLIRRPNTNQGVLYACRGGSSGSGWYYRYSNDWGATWGTETRWFGYQYPAYRMVGTTLKVAMTQLNPENANNQIRAFYINLSTGTVFSAAGTQLSSNYNLWAQTQPIDSNQCNQVTSVTGDRRVRLHAVGPSHSCLVAKWDSPDQIGEYYVMRHNGSGSWTEELLVSTGYPLGYYESEGGSNYYGGGWFDDDDDTLYLCRESSGTWTLERWERSGAGTWSSVATLLTRTDGRKLGRPLVPVGAEGTGWVVVGDYHNYEPDNYTEYYADAVLVRYEA